MMQLEITDKERAQVGEDLKKLSQLFGAAHVVFASTEVIAHRAGFDFAPIKGQVDEAINLLSMAHDTHTGLSAVLHRTRVAGSTSPKKQTSELSDLAVMGGDDSRELLDLLERAQAVAERIDAARGRCVDESIPLHPGESRGTDLAESLSVLALRVRKDVQGGVSPHE